MKKIILLVTTLLLWMPAEGNAQKWLRDLGNAVKSVDKALGGSSSSESSSSSSTMAAVGVTQQGGTKIVTNHPDLKIKITRCVASGRTCVINMIVTNVSDQDIKVRFFGGGCGSRAFDDEGNQYADGLTIGTTRFTDCVFDMSLPSNVPSKLTMQIEKVPEGATQLSRINLSCECSSFSLSSSKPITISNVPISRDGDE